MSENIRICKICVCEMFQKFTLDENGNPITEGADITTTLMEWKCPQCGSTTTGVTLLEIYDQVKQNTKDINKLKEVN